MITDEPIHIDDLAERCGYFNNDVDTNNGYGCNHLQQSETDYARVRDGHSYNVKDRAVQMVLLRKHFGSYANIVQADQRGEALAYLREAQYDNSILATIGIKQQGKCFAHSCPIASCMDRQDWIERGEDPDDYGEVWLMPFDLTSNLP